MTESATMTVKEACATLQVSRWTLWRMRKRGALEWGLLPGTNIVRIPRAAVEAIVLRLHGPAPELISPRRPLKHFRQA